MTYYTYRQLYLNALYVSKGLNWYDAAKHKLYSQNNPDYDQCYLCHRKPDYLYHYITLTPIYLPDNIALDYTTPIQHIC